MSFTSRLLELMERSGFTQYELAKRSGLSKQTLSHLVRGRRDPSWRTVQALALVMGLPTDAFRDADLSVPIAPHTPAEGTARGRRTGKALGVAPAASGRSKPGKRSGKTPKGR
jgi:transcriptional regulator with XRE-family HTH domain